MNNEHKLKSTDNVIRERVCFRNVAIGKGMIAHENCNSVTEHLLLHFIRVFLKRQGNRAGRILL